MRGDVVGAIVGLAMGACAPADVSGFYAVTISGGQNGCNIGGWTADATLFATFVQNGPALEVTVSGDYAEPFRGTVTGSRFVVSRRSEPRSRGGCQYTLIEEIPGNLAGDTITGTVRYYAETNQSADCAELLTCESTEPYTAWR